MICFVIIVTMVALETVVMINAALTECSAMIVMKVALETVVMTNAALNLAENLVKTADSLLVKEIVERLRLSAAIVFMALHWNYVKGNVTVSALSLFMFSPTGDFACYARSITGYTMRLSCGYEYGG